MLLIPFPSDFNLKQALVKEPKEAGLKKHSPLVQKFLEELVKIGIYSS